MRASSRGSPAGEKAPDRCGAGDRLQRLALALPAFALGGDQSVTEGIPEAVVDVAVLVVVTVGVLQDLMDKRGVVDQVEADDAAVADEIPVILDQPLEEVGRISREHPLVVKCRRFRESSRERSFRFSRVPRGHEVKCLPSQLHREQDERRVTGQARFHQPIISGETSVVPMVCVGADLEFRPDWADRLSGARGRDACLLVRPKSLRKLRDSIKPRTRRTNGKSMDAIVADLNRTLEGWHAYFKHARASVFGPLDGWVRMRLRSILRKRQGGKGRSHGRNHQRWPNRYFTRLGLYGLLDARALEIASLRNGANH